jgi:hypothetical protein
MLGNWTQGLAHTRQVFCYLSYTSSPLFLFCVFETGSYCYLFQDSPWTQNSPVSICQIAEITDMQHHTCLVFCFSLLGFELRAPSLIGRRCVSWAMPPALCALVVLEIESHFPRVDLDHDPLLSSYFMFPTIAGMTGTNHHTQLFFPLKWGLANFLAQAYLELRSPRSLSSK